MVDTNTDTDIDTDMTSLSSDNPETDAGNKGSRDTDPCCADTPAPPTLHPCLQFLTSTSADHPFTVKHSELLQDTTLVTNRAMPPGSLLFRLGSEYLLTYERVCATPISRLIHGLPTIEISPEELTWLNMIVWLTWSSEEDNNKKDYDGNKNFHTHLKALSEIPPVASSWSTLLQDELIGTNVYAVLDPSGNSNDIVGNVIVVPNLLRLLERIRTVLLKHTEKFQNDKQEEDARQILLTEQGSIFTVRSISWARGHFLSRRFPNRLFQPNSAVAQSSRPPITNHLPGYGGRTATFIPVLDLMNHNPEKKNTCTVELSEDGQHVEICTGEVALESGDELHYCYGETLANEVLLQGYGFCLPNNPADTVSVRINSNNGNSSSASFEIGRGGAEAIPSDMWRALAGAVPAFSSDEEEPAMEIGSGDLECLLEYMTNKLTQLNAPPTTTTATASDSMTQKEQANANDANLCRERRAFIEMYKTGQREILVELIRDLTLMLAPA